MTLVIGGRTVPVPGLRGVSFVDRAEARLTSRRDFRARPADKWVRGIVLHTRMGLPVVVRPGIGRNVGWDLVLARRFSDDDRQASCHIAIDADGSYACLADLQLVTTYHAGQCNDVSVGIEMYQDTDGGVSESTMDACVLICDVLTRELGIQRQYAVEDAICRRLASPTHGVDAATKLAYVKGGGRGADFVGLYGHRNCTRNRGKGDPGDQIWQRFKAAGYEGYRIDEGEDLDVWADRQHDLGMEPSDCLGVPDRITRAHVTLTRGKPHGLWVDRPGDATMDGLVT